MKTNEKAIEHLYNLGWSKSSARDMVRDLVDGGFIELELSRSERYAQAARDWVSDETESKNVFKYAVGWSTTSWETVTGESLRHNIPALTDIFWALVILAKEAGEL